MLKEFECVRIKATGEYGIIVDMQLGSDHCMVELDGRQCGGQADEPDQWLRTLALSEVDELVKVQGSDRKAVFGEFDTLVIPFCNQRVFVDSPTIAIKRTDRATRVTVRSLSFDEGINIKEASTDEGASVNKLLSAVFATHAERWVEPFEPDHAALDGYSWTMRIFSGNRYFECEGSNFMPDELAQLLCAVREMGLPLS